jgi:hypothetical protein
MTEGTALDKTIARIASRQAGVVTRAQLTDAGVSRHVLRRRLQAERLVPAGCSVYVIGGVPSSWKRAALAACLDLGSEAVLSHRSAAAVWKLSLATGEVIDVTVPYSHSARRSSPNVNVRRSRLLTAADRAVVRGLPVTSVERTIVDLAAVVEAEELATCLDDALCRRMVSPASLAKALDRLASKGRRGTTYLRRLLRPWLDGKRVESVAEGQVRRVIASAGLAEPVTRHEVYTSEGHFVGRLDFAWPSRRLALEVDGFRWHANPAAQVNDAVRANRLAALGWTVLRTTPAEIRAGGEHVLAAVRRHLDEK